MTKMSEIWLFFLQSVEGGQILSLRKVKTWRFQRIGSGMKNADTLVPALTLWSFL
jgi:hypothetical protein